IDFLLNVPLRIFNHRYFRVAGLSVEEYEAHQKTIFSPDHRRALPVYNFRNLSQGNLRSRGSRNENVSYGIGAVSPFSCIARADRETFSSLHRGAEHHTA